MLFTICFKRDLVIIFWIQRKKGWWKSFPQIINIQNSTHSTKYYTKI